MGTSTSTKMTTLHYFRDPIMEVFGSDRDIDLSGVIVYGTSQDNEVKTMVGERVAQIAQAMRLEGAVAYLDGYGNCHVDFCNMIQEVGEKGIEVQALTFIGKNDMVVTNEHMKNVIDICKCREGMENSKNGDNTINHIDAIKALAFLKLKMRG